MAREKNPNREYAYKLWKEHGGNITNREIANLLNEDEKKIAVWKQRDKWNVVQQNDKTVVQQKKKPGAPKGNKNAKGGPVGNNKAMTHGLFATYLPAETLELAQSFAEKSPIDLLWENICIKYAAIIRAQQIMFVKSKDEIVKYLKSESENSATWEFQYPWDRQAKFLAAQSRAMGTLNNMIKQYDELLRSNLATKEQRLRVQKLKTEIKKISEETNDSNQAKTYEICWLSDDNGDSERKDNNPI